MKKIIFTLFLFVVLSFNLKVLSQADWTYYSDKSIDETTGKFYYDKNSIEYNDDNTINIWIIYDLDEKTYIEWMKKYNDYSLMRIKLLCGVNAHVLTYAEGYFTDGTSTGESKANSYRENKYYSHVEILYNMFCR